MVPDPATPASRGGSVGVPRRKNCGNCGRLTP